MNSDIKYINAFNLIPGIGPATLRALKEQYTSFEDAWRSGDTDLERAGVAPRARALVHWKRASIHPDREMERMVREKIWMITEDDENFPRSLKEIPQSPIALYGKGNMTLLSGAESHTFCAIVGTRRPTHYGLDAAETIVRELTAHSIVIVSGLASGIDARAHHTAVECGGKTIAVLGSGIDTPSIFPQENILLAKRIAQSGGIVVSEYALGTPAMREHFPQRNRIISGLSRGVLVVEAREKSGALITARLALDQNRDVFAVPGPIFSSTSRGPNKLIQEGAKLIRSANDILEEFGIEYTKKDGERKSGVLSEKEWTLLEILSEPAGVDEIKERTGWQSSEIISTLSMLELKGYVKNTEADVYQKV